jgi:AcrR family transcriptional regulator
MAASGTSFQTIMEAAEALIREKGCRQTTLQDMIRRTGLSKGAIYHYVTGKDELFGLVLKSRVEQINARFTEVVTDPEHTSGFHGSLQLIAERMIRATHPQDVTNNIFIYLLGQMDNPTTAAIVQEVYEYTMQTCINWINVGKMKEVIPPDADSRRIAESLIVFMYGMRVQHTIMQEQGRITSQDLTAFLSRSLR